MRECRLQISWWWPQETWGPLRPPGLYPSLHHSDVRTGRAWSAYRPMPVHAGSPIVLAQAVAHRKIATAGALRGALLHEDSRPTLVKPSKRPKKPPHSSARPLTRSYSTKTHQRSYPSTPGKRWVACPTGARQHWLRVPSAHQNRRPQPRRTVGRWERKKNSKRARSTNSQTTSPSLPAD